MEFTLTINTDNAAFEEGFEEELDFVFRQARWKVIAQREREPALCEHPESVDVLLDGNGNKIGRVVVRP